MQKEITQDFYPHRRDDDSYANLLPENNPTYPTQGEIAGLLENVSALTQQAEGAAGRSETAAAAATDAVAAAKGHADNAKSSADAAGQSAATAEAHAKTIEQTKTALTELKGQVDQALVNANGAMGGAQTAQQETQRLRDNVAQLEAAAKGHADRAKSSADAAGQSAATAEGQANRAGQLKTETESLSNQIRSYVDDVFPAKMQSAETMINGVVSEVRSTVNGILETAEREVTNTVNGATSAINSKATSTIEEVEGKRQAAVTALETTKDEVIEAVGAAKRDAIDSVESQANHAVQTLTTTLTNAQTEINGKVTNATTAATNAQTSASNANTSATNAKTSEDNAKQTADSLSAGLTTLNSFDGRLGSLEESVPGKMPYLSKYVTKYFDVLRGNFRMLNIAVVTGLHEGFLLRDSYSNAKDRLVVPGLNQVIQVDSVGTVCLSVIEADKTTIYSCGNNLFYKTTVSGTGEALSFVRETVDALPATVAALSGVVGWKTSAGFVVCTKGHILSADLETEIATFYAVTSYKLMRKNGDAFYFYDAVTKKFATLKLEENGSPTITYNGYTQTAGTFYPITATCYVKRNSSGLYLGATAESIGYLYRESTSKECLFGATVMGGKPLLFFANRAVYLLDTETNTACELALTVANGLFDNIDPTGTRYQFFEVDFRGNILYAYYSWHNGGRSDQPYVLFRKK